MSVSEKNCFDLFFKGLNEKFIQFLNFIDPSNENIYKNIIGDTFAELHQDDVISLQTPQFLIAEKYKDDQQQYLLFVRQIITRISSLMRLFKDIQLNKDQLAQIQIQKPIVIVGLPRTGSTSLFNLMCCHSKAHYFSAWQTLCPGYSTITEEAQRKFTLRLKNVMKSGNAEFDKIHTVDIDSNEECIFQYDCYGINFSHCIALPQFSLSTPNLLSSWKTLMDFEWNVYKLNLLRKPMDPSQFLIIKNVTLLCVLKEVLDSCPDINVVWIHRNPYDIIKSSIPYFKTIQGAFLTPENKCIITDEWLYNNIIDVENQILKKAVESRNNWIKESPSRRNQIYDVQFNDFIQNPITTVCSIYDHFGLKSSPEDVESMNKKYESDIQNQVGQMKVSDETIKDYQGEIAKVFEWYTQSFLSKKV